MSRRGKTRVSRTFKHGFEVPAGPSIRERVEQDLDAAMARYLRLKAEDGTDREVAIARGEVRGLARAMGRIMNPYEPIRGMKAAEKQSLRRVKELTDAVRLHQDRG